MTDKEILDELISQKDWWEYRIKECHEKETEYKKELYKTNRLIELIQSKMD